LLAFASRSKGYPEPESVSEAGPALTENENIDVVSETVSTALAALDALGWNTEPARLAVETAATQVVTPPRSVMFLGEEVTLLDAFSANDTQSLDRLWSEWRRGFGDLSDWSVLLNTRADRPLRTRQFCRWLEARNDVDEVYVAGSHRAAAVRLLRKQSLRVTQVPADTTKVIACSDGSPDPPEKRRILVGIGNVHGLGLGMRGATEGSKH
jgi:hypothetical protein